MKKLIYVSMILIFIAHATITDSQQKQSSGAPKTLEAIFDDELPSLALTQVGDFILLIVDRILEAPSVWQMCLSPLLLWLTSHVEDGLL